MSWLFVVFFPGLLMICTVGLQRLERMVHGERPSACQLVTRLEQAARTARERAAQRTLNEFSGVEPQARLDPVFLVDEPGLPTRPNPLFQPSGPANRV
ncbi:MAG: hypothetical protein KDB56_17465 [Mycobacterium sp.]|nr:hypothetical protein [Mycobacterium sp.]